MIPFINIRFYFFRFAFLGKRIKSIAFPRFIVDSIYVLANNFNHIFIEDFFTVAGMKLINDRWVDFFKFVISHKLFLFHKRKLSFQAWYFIISCFYLLNIFITLFWSIDKIFLKIVIFFIKIFDLFLEIFGFGNKFILFVLKIFFMGVVIDGFFKQLFDCLFFIKNLLILLF